MLREELRNIKSARRDLRNFGLVVGGVLLVLGVLLLWRHRPAWTYLIWPGAALLSLGLVAPTVLKPLQKAWMTLAVLMGWVMTRVILSVLFFLIITPISLLSRLTGKKWLELDWKADNESYWIRKETGAKRPEDYEKQF